MTDESMHRYALVVSPTDRRQLAVELPESVAAAALEFITGRCWTTHGWWGTR